MKKEKWEYQASIIIPTRHRAALFEQRLDQLIQNTPEVKHNFAEIIVALDEDDEETKALIARYPYIKVHTNAPQEIPCIKWNNAAKMAKGEWLVTISDDCIPQLSWLTSALNMLNLGFLGLPDGVTGNRNHIFTPLYMATRKWLSENNGGVLVIPVYKTWYADIETCLRAKRSHTYQVAWNSVCRQLHKEFLTAPDDAIYRLGEERRAKDKETYESRAARGFPNDFERIF